VVERLPGDRPDRLLRAPVDFAVAVGLPAAAVPGMPAELRDVADVVAVRVDEPLRVAVVGQRVGGAGRDRRLFDRGGAGGAGRADRELAALEFAA